MAHADLPSPVSIDELLQFICTVVANRFHEKQKATNGAFLANAVYRRFPAINYRALGIERLGDAVTEAESRGLLVRNRAVTHLEILPPSVTVPAASLVPAVKGRLVHVRQDVWQAFAFVASPGTVWFYDRQSRRVLHSEEVASDDEHRYAKIHPIPIDEQQDWMREFMRSSPELDSHLAPIRDSHCFTTFPQWLAEHRSGLDRDWKRFRVQRVTDHVREWCANNGLSADEFFDDPKPKLAATATRNDLLVGSEAAIRAAIIAAVSEMPIEQLGEICIPVRYILRHLRTH